MKWKRVSATLAIVVVPLIAAWWLAADVRNVNIDFLNVGQGDAVLVRHGATEILIDAGPDHSVLVGLGQAMPFFDRTIETIIITHPHADHFEGLTAVIERYRVKRLVFGPGVSRPARYDEIIETARQTGTQIVSSLVGDQIDLGGGARFTVLWPTDDSTAKSEAGQDDGSVENQSANDQSLVWRLAVPCSWLDQNGDDCGAVLFMGDAGFAVENELIASAERGEMDITAQLLKIGHHGSTYATSGAFLAAVKPAVAAISVGKNNFGHPSPLTLRRLAYASVNVFRTDQDGRLRVVFSPNGKPDLGTPACPSLAYRWHWCGHRPALSNP
ncbi:MAG: MBL fold metallo-hydrolase [Patescibacteria group bacterium]|nr:MBL fold metallo-hydrolase [Patescibacteria group bacterium]